MHLWIVDARLSACWSLLLCWFDGFAAHSRQSACGLINGIASPEAVCGCNTCFSDKAPKNVFANSRQTRVIHQLVGDFPCTCARLCAVVQRAAKAFFLQRAQDFLAGPRHIGRSCLKGCCKDKEQQCSSRKCHVHAFILPLPFSAWMDAVWWNQAMVLKIGHA